MQQRRAWLCFGLVARYPKRCQSTRVRACSPRPRKGAGVAASLVSLAIVTFGPRANALELSFSGSAPCATDEITFRVEKALAQPLASVAGPTFRVDIERAPIGFVGRVDVPGQAGGAVESSERRVTATSCDELVDTLALAIVLAIAWQRDASASSLAASVPPPVESTSAFSGEATPPDAAGETDPNGSRAAEPSTAGPQLSAFGAMVADAGSLPALGLGVAVGVDVAWTALELRALGMLLPGADGSVDRRDPASPGAEIGLVAGALLACAPLSTRAAGATLAACVGAELGRLSGHGTRIDTSHSSTTWWAAPRADIGARWALPVSWLAIELGVTVAAPIWRDEFVLEEVGSVHRPAAVVGRATLSLRAQFGR
jgi:hypothetical protein